MRDSSSRRGAGPRGRALVKSAAAAACALLVWGGAGPGAARAQGDDRYRVTVRAMLMQEPVFPGDPPKPQPTTPPVPQLTVDGRPEPLDANGYATVLMRPGEHTLSVRVPGWPATQITGATYFDNQRQVEVKADALGNIRLYLGESFYTSVSPEIIIWGSLRSGLALKIRTTQACSPDENERGEILGGVTVKVGDKVVTTNAEGEAVLALAPGDYPVTATWKDAGLAFVRHHQILRFSERGYVVRLSESHEAIEVRMATCDPRSGQRRARARVSEIGDRMTLVIKRADGGPDLEQPATVGLVLRDGDHLLVRGTGKLEWLEGGTISFNDGRRQTRIIIGPERPAGTPESPGRISILQGLVNFFLPPSEPQKKNKFEASTGTVKTSVKGTAFSVDYDERTQVSAVSVQEGEVEVTPLNSSLQALTLRAGQQVEVARDNVGAVRPNSGSAGGGRADEIGAILRRPPTAPVSKGAIQDLATERPAPVYPPAAAAARATGQVLVSVTVDEAGNVVAARAVSGHPLLLEAAVEAARRWKFTPATASGQPVKMTGTIRIVFAQ